MQRDFPPLLDPGFHDLDLKQVEDLCVTQFSNNDRRGKIWERFNAFLNQLRSTGLDYELWLDGSFLTEKDTPADIDAVVFYDPIAVNLLPANHRATLGRLFTDRQVTKLRYLTDAFFIPNVDPNDRMYWRGCFGFDRHDNPKGFVRFNLRAQ